MTPSTSLFPDSPQRLDLIARARRTVLQSGQIGAVSGGSGVSAEIERSWYRCLAMGHDPQQRVEFNAISAAQVRQALEANRPLLQAAAPVIRTLTRAMLHTRHFAILTDASGTVIEVHGPVDRNDPPARAIARLGIDLSEAAVGTTAIGTTLAEQQPVWLHGGEHFFNDTSVFSCAGAPITGPDGHCVGMLDLTGVNVSEQPALKHLVTQSARSIENALILAQPHRLLLRLNWPGRLLGDDSDGLVCLDGEGFITGMNRSAAQLLSAQPNRAGTHADSVIAMPYTELFDAARTGRGALEVPLWSGLRLLVLAQWRRETRPGEPADPCPGLASHAVPLKIHETWMIRKAVEDAGGNVMEAAKALGISRATVYRRLQNRKPSC